MTKQEMLKYLDTYDEDEEIDLCELERELEERRQERIAELEERQENNGFYAFQDAMENWRRER